MSFTNPFSTKTPGLSTIGAAEVNLCGNQQVNSIDGGAGGTYNPTDPISIGGDGVEVTTTLSCPLGSTVTLEGTTSIESAALLGITAAEDVIVTGTLDVTGQATLGPVDINGTTTLDGATTASDLTMSGTTNVKLASRSITRVQSSQATTDDDSGWVLDNTSGKMLQIDTSQLPRVVSPLRVPHGATLTAVGISINPADGHANLPANMPIVDVYALDYDGTVTPIGSATDGSANVAAYEAHHEIPVSGLSVTIDRTTKRYFATLRGESGANSAINLLYVATKATYTITRYDED